MVTVTIKEEEKTTKRKQTELDYVITMLCKTADAVFEIGEILGQTMLELEVCKTKKTKIKSSHIVSVVV